MSRLSSCPENYWEDLKNPQRISETLNQIFDDGNDVHDEREILTDGARKNIKLEGPIKIMHESGLFILKGTPDARLFDFNGRYIKDYKTTERGGFYYFLKEGWSEDYRKQLSGYAYLVYVKTGVYIQDGVIEKVDKKNPRAYMGLPDKLYELPKTRNFILKHPVILRWFGKITEEQFIQICIGLMKDEKWKCNNCSYKETCKVYPNL